MKWAVAAIMAAAGPAMADDAADIRAARGRYNAAIAAHDTAAIRAMFIDDYMGIAGSGGEVIAGGDAMTAYFAGAFGNPAFRGFVRTPDVVTVAVPPDRAMERGRWSGQGVAGDYLAVWVPTPQGWRLRSETFVTLSRITSP